MFSYRHGFHAGSHADVLKHIVLIAALKHLTAKPASILVADTHAGAGLYRLDDNFAQTSGEAAGGIVKLAAELPAARAASLVRDYLDLVASFNRKGKLRVYPGSPFVAHAHLRSDDKLRLFELHPSDSQALETHVEQLNAPRQVAVQRADGFTGLKALLPPPSRRGLVLIDPSFEIKSDYARVTACLQESLKKFSTGTYMIWYPVIPRPEAHELPRRLKAIANQNGRDWLNAALNIGLQDALPGELPPPRGLTASGVFLVNPPYTLRAGLAEALPQLVETLGRGRGQGFTLEAS